MKIKKSANRLARQISAQINWLDELKQDQARFIESGDRNAVMAVGDDIDMATETLEKLHKELEEYFGHPIPRDRNK